MHHLIIWLLVAAALYGLHRWICAIHRSAGHKEGFKARSKLIASGIEHLPRRPIGGVLPSDAGHIIASDVEGLMVKNRGANYNLDINKHAYPVFTHDHQI